MRKIIWAALSGREYRLNNLCLLAVLVIAWSTTIFEPTLWPIVLIASVMLIFGVFAPRVAAILAHQSQK
jgi:hypothetical protein